MNARCHKEHALFNRLSSSNNNNVSASASACSFCGSLSAEMATATAASHTCGEMQRKNQNKMQANAQECETARDAETQAQTATATAAVLSQRSCSQRWQRSLLSTSSSIAYAQIDSGSSACQLLCSRSSSRSRFVDFVRSPHAAARARRKL